MDEKIKLAFELRKQGLSLKKIEKETGINFRDLSVIFKYLNSLDCNPNEYRTLKTKIDFLEEQNEKLKNLIETEEKEKKDLALQLNTSKYSIKILKPTFFVFVIVIMFLVGAGLGVFVSSKNYIKTYLAKVYNLDKKEAELLNFKNNLIAKYNADKIALKNEYLKKLNDKTKLQNFLKIYNINFKISGDNLELVSKKAFQIRYMNEYDNPVAINVKKLVIEPELK